MITLGEKYYFQSPYEEYKKYNGQWGKIVGINIVENEEIENSTFDIELKCGEIIPTLEEELHNSAWAFHKKIHLTIAGAMIDFHLNKKKYRGYKTNLGRFNYIQRCLDKILNSLKGTVHNDIELREISITPNHFWGVDEHTIINDIGYSYNNLVALNDNFITIRIMDIDVVGIVKDNIIIDDISKQFIKIKTKDYHFNITNSKIV